MLLTSDHLGWTSVVSGCRPNIHYSFSVTHTNTHTHGSGCIYLLHGSCLIGICAVSCSFREVSWLLKILWGQRSSPGSAVLISGQRSEAGTVTARLFRVKRAMVCSAVEKSSAEFCRKSLYLLSVFFTPTVTTLLWIIRRSFHVLLGLFFLVLLLKHYFFIFKVKVKIGRSLQFNYYKSLCEFALVFVYRHRFASFCRFCACVIFSEYVCFLVSLCICFYL